MSRAPQASLPPLLAGRAAPYLCLALAAFAVHARLLLASSDFIINTPDINFYFLWLYGYTRDALLSGRVPLWNPYIYAGVPYAANPQNSIFYLPSWIHCAMPVAAAHKWLIFGHCVLAGWAMILFLRKIGTGALAAFAGALPYALGGYFMANAAVGHLPMIYTMSWIPLVLFFAERHAQDSSVSGIVGAGVCVGIVALAGEPQNLYYTALIVALFLFIRSFPASEGRPPGRVARFLAEFALKVAGIGGIAAFLSAIQLLPTAELAIHSDRSSASFDFSTHMSAPPSAFAGFLLPWFAQEFAGLIVFGRFQLVPWSWEFAGYAGLAVPCLALLSAFIPGSRSNSAARGLLLLGIVLMLGAYTPLYRILYAALPGLSLFRVPGRAIVILLIGLCMTAALALQAILDGAVPPARLLLWRRLCAAGLLALAGFLLASMAQGGNYLAPTSLTAAPAVPFPPGSLYLWKSAVLMASLAIALLGWRAAMRVSLPLLLVSHLAIDLVLCAPSIPTVKFIPGENWDLKVLNAARADGEAKRLMFRVDFSSSNITTNAAMAAKVENVNGYWPFAIGRFFHYVHAMRGAAVHARHRHAILDEAYRSAAPFPLAPLNVFYGSHWPAGEPAPIMVREANPLPRAWLVRRAEVMPEGARILERLASPQFDPATTVVLEREFPLPGGASPPDSRESCAARRIDDETLEIEVNAASSAYLVLSEIYYPGWKATLDGQPIARARADYCLTALAIPPGRHLIRYSYEPASFKIGAWLSALTILCLIAIPSYRRFWRK